MLFGLFYGAILLAILYMLFRMVRPVQTVVIREEPQIIPESSWWSFPMTSYNHWPYWSGWWSGGGGGGYRPRYEGPRGGIPHGGHRGRH